MGWGSTPLLSANIAAATHRVEQHLVRSSNPGHHFMIVYSNSCSYGVISDGKVYGNFVAEHYNATFINGGSVGSCNERIFRVSVRDVLNLVKIHKPSDIIVLIGLTNTFRGETWDEQAAGTDDGHFCSFTASNNNLHQSYIKEFYKIYNQESAITDLTCQLVMLTSFLRDIGVQYLIWSNTPHLKSIDWSANFVNPFYKKIVADNNIFSLFDLNFIDYVSSRGHTPLDNSYDQGGHANEQAHKDFSNLLITELCKRDNQKTCQ